MKAQICVIGAGNGGKATAADLALQGCNVRLFQFEDFALKEFTTELLASCTLHVNGVVKGDATLEYVGSNLEKAIEGADMIFVCTVALAHQQVAEALFPLVNSNHTIVLNPGSTGGALHFARVFREQGMRDLPTIAEFGTLTYGCRASQSEVNINVKVSLLHYGVFPNSAAAAVAPKLEMFFPGLKLVESTLAAGLCNANPVIHPSITLTNMARLTGPDSSMLFYKDGVCRENANIIEALDRERLALASALGYHLMPDPQMCVAQGYADSANSYYECYALGKVFGGFAAPHAVQLDTHRYIAEDVGVGLVLYSSLGRLLKVATPVADSVIAMASAAAKRDFASEQQRTVHTLGIAELTPVQIHKYLETGEYRCTSSSSGSGSSSTA